MTGRLIKYKKFIKTCIIEGGFSPRYITVLKSSLIEEDRLDLYTETIKLINNKMKEIRSYERCGYLVSSLTMISGMTISLLTNNIEFIIPLLVLIKISLNQLNLNTSFELKELSKIKTNVLEILDNEDVMKKIEEDK